MENEEVRLLKVGDEVLVEGRWDKAPSRKLKVTQENKTTFYVGSDEDSRLYKVKKEVSENGHVWLASSDWDSPSLTLAEGKHLEAYRANLTLHSLKKSVEILQNRLARVNPRDLANQNHPAQPLLVDAINSVIGSNRELVKLFKDVLGLDAPLAGIKKD